MRRTRLRHVTALASHKILDLSCFSLLLDKTRTPHIPELTNSINMDLNRKRDPLPDPSANAQSAPTTGMWKGNPTSTYRTRRGFGQATNNSLLWPLQDLHHLVLNQQDYVLAQLTDANKESGKTRPGKIAKLPDDLLLQIVQGINGTTRNKDLISISLTCPRLCGVAQEALLSTAIVYPQNMEGYMVKLMQNRAYRILGCFQPSERQRLRRWVGFMGAICLQTDRSKDVVQTGSIPNGRCDQRVVSQADLSPKYTLQTECGLCLGLLQLLQNLTELSVTHNFILSNPGFRELCTETDQSDNVWNWRLLSHLQFRCKS